MRAVLIVILTAILTAGALPGNCAEKPDMVLIISDDQSFEALGYLGMIDVETPNLDRLAKSGITFTHAYNMGSWSGAVCVASRHMLHTGAFVWKARHLASALGKGDQGGNDLLTKGLMWSQLMKKAGYDTYLSGKWHVQANPEQVFDTVRHVRPGMPKDTREGYNRPLENQPDPWNPADPKFGGFWEGGKHWSEVLADDAEEFIRTAQGKDHPFFMCLAFNAPHDPRQSPPEFLDRYPLTRISLPENYLPEYPFKDFMDCGRGLRDEQLAPFPRSENAVKVHRREYYALITHMDLQIGRILKALETSGRKERTYVFFTSDHGLALGRHGLMGKQNLFDHSLRVPLIVAGPGIGAGERSDAPVYLQDIMATALELAGAAKPEHVQFQSLKAVWEGRSSGYPAIYGAYLSSQRCVIKGSHKLLLFPNVPKIQLFDLESDPFEMTDIHAGNMTLAQELYLELVRLQRETGDPLALDAAFPELAPSR